MRRLESLTIDGMDVDELILRNADPIWLHQNEMWELIDPTDYTKTVGLIDDDGQVPVAAHEHDYEAVGDDNDHAVDGEIPFPTHNDGATDDEIPF